MTPFLPTLALIGLLPSDGPVTWSFASVQAANGSVLIELTAQLEMGWHIYATELPSDEGPIATTFRFTPSPAFAVLGELAEPKAEEHFDPNFEMTVRYHSDAPRFVLTVVPNTLEAFSVEGEVEFMVCNDKTCLPPTVVPFSVRIEPVLKK